MKAQTPTTPDLSFVKDLQPGVAYAVLFVIALSILMFYLGPSIRARLAPKDDPKPEPAKTEPVTQQVPSLPAAMDRADLVSQQFLDHVLRQLRDVEAENVDLKRDVERLERELRDIRYERDQLRWQRGMR